MKEFQELPADKMLLVNLFFVCLAIGLGAAYEQDVVRWQGNWVLNKKPISYEISGSRLTASFKPDAYLLETLYLDIVANETNKRFYWEFNCVKNCDSVGVAQNYNYHSNGRQIKGGNADEQTRCFND